MAGVDEINREILRLLCEDSRYHYSELQKHLEEAGYKLTREAVEYRVKKMIEGGVIKKFAMITDPEKIGYQLCCYIAINLVDPKDRDGIGEMLAKMPNTAYVHSATHSFDIATRIFFTDTKDLISFLDTLEADGRIRDFDLDIIRKTYKVGPIYPI